MENSDNRSMLLGRNIAAYCQTSIIADGIAICDSHSEVRFVNQTWYGSDISSNIHLSGANEPEENPQAEVSLPFNAKLNKKLKDRKSVHQNKSNTFRRTFNRNFLNSVKFLENHKLRLQKAEAKLQHLNIRRRLCFQNQQRRSVKDGISGTKDAAWSA